MVGNECDIAASAITIRPDREENIDFSDGYFDADQSLMVKTDSGYTSYDDLVGLRLGVQAGTTGEAYANDNNPGGVEIVSFGESADLFVAMEAGDIQGILQDLPVNAERMLGDDTLTVVATYPTGEVYGFAVKEEGKEALLKRSTKLWPPSRATAPTTPSTTSTSSKPNLKVSLRGTRLGSPLSLETGDDVMKKSTKAKLRRGSPLRHADRDIRRLVVIAADWPNNPESVLQS